MNESLVYFNRDAYNPLVPYVWGIEKDEDGIWVVALTCLNKQNSDSFAILKNKEHSLLNVHLDEFIEFVDDVGARW